MMATVTTVKFFLNDWLCPLGIQIVRETSVLSFEIRRQLVTSQALDSVNRAQLDGNRLQTSMITVV